MNFNADRLGKLAGLKNNTRRSLNEAGNRSQHEDPGKPDDVDHRWGKNQLNEKDDDYGGNKGDESKSKRDYLEELDMLESEWGGNKGDEADVNEIMHGSRKGGSGEMADPSLDYSGDMLGEMEDPEWLGEDEDEVVLELDERMLRGEIMRMRREKSARLEEGQLRKAIRNEIQGIFSELDLYKTDNKWVYGDNQPRNSSRGYVNLAFPGVGFR